MDGAGSHAVWCGGRKEGLVDRCLEMGSTCNLPSRFGRIFYVSRIYGREFKRDIEGYSSVQSLP